MKYFSLFMAMCIALILPDRVLVGRSGRIIGRMKFRDVGTAIKYRMGAGFPGDVNRTHPASIEPALVNATTPPTLYGNPVVVDGTTNSVRAIGAGEQSDTVAVNPWGFVVRPFPTQQRTGGDSSSFGTGVPPTSGAIDVLKTGYIMAQLNAGSATVKKGDPVYVWAAATSTTHLQGGLEPAFTTTKTALLANCFFNGPQDANGVVEIICED